MLWSFSPRCDWTEKYNYKFKRYRYKNKHFLSTPVPSFQYFHCLSLSLLATEKNGSRILPFIKLTKRRSSFDRSYWSVCRNRRYLCWNSFNEFLNHFLSFQVELPMCWSVSRWTPSRWRCRPFHICTATRSSAFGRLLLRWAVLFCCESFCNFNHRRSSSSSGRHPPRPVRRHTARTGGKHCRKFGPFLRLRLLPEAGAGGHTEGLLQCAGECHRGYVPLFVHASLTSLLV